MSYVGQIGRIGQLWSYVRQIGRVGQLMGPDWMASVYHVFLTFLRAFGLKLRLARSFQTLIQ